MATMVEYLTDVEKRHRKIVDALKGYVPWETTESDIRRMVVQDVPKLLEIAKQWQRS